MKSTVARFHFRARHADVRGHVEQLERALPASVRNDLVRIGLAEALTNAIVHGALGVSRRGDVEAYLAAITVAEAQGDRIVNAEVHGSSERVEVVINDQGAGFDWRSASPKRGHGLAIVEEVFECVSWNEAGNEVRLVLKAAS